MGRSRRSGCNLQAEGQAQWQTSSRISSTTVVLLSFVAWWLVSAAGLSSMHTSHSSSMIITGCDAFVVTSRSTRKQTSGGGVHRSQNDAEVEAASALTEFMAKAHEEKIAAMKRIEDQSKTKIDELESEIAILKQTIQTLNTPKTGNSFVFPASNKDLTMKVDAYRKFISEYIVKSQQDKFNAVKIAENILKAKYETIIEEMKT
mmetsp:Transcript_23196/g.55004  ORF Transcript_23196/g.55004 Transcript_23196/m.55004 type:complete len:204 (+) Transcript_23196:91-702(+)